MAEAIKQEYRLVGLALVSAPPLAQLRDPFGAVHDRSLRGLINAEETKADRGADGAALMSTQTVTVQSRPP